MRLNRLFIKKAQWLSFSLLLMVAFTNCTHSLPGESSDSNSGSLESPSTSGDPKDPNAPRLEGANICETDLMNLFARGYYSFARQHCASCHESGPGKGRFAANDPNAAYLDFQQITYVSISNNAVSSSHKPPSTGPQHIQTIADLKNEWTKGLAEYSACAKQPVIQPPVDVSNQIKFETTKKQVPSQVLQNRAGTLTWKISSDIKKADGTAANLVSGEGMFELTVQRVKTASGQTYYVFSQPRIYGSNADLRVKTLLIKVNGELPKYQTTFRYVDAAIRAGSTQKSADSLVSIGSLVLPGVISPQDMISVGFELVEVTNIPPPPEPVTVTIEGPGVLIPDASTGAIELTVSLSQAVQVAVGVTFQQQDRTGTCFELPQNSQMDPTTLVKTVGDSNCFPQVKTHLCGLGKCGEDLKVSYARSTAGTEYNRFDWDFKFTESSLNFSPGETKKTFRVILSKNTRHETNRLLSLAIAGLSGPVIMGAQTQVHLVLNKLVNPVPNPNIPTYTELMNPETGILGVNCLKCHNSKDKNGGYDVSDYDGMVAAKVLVPGNASGSKMFQRLNPNDPNSTYLQPMPLDGFMEQSLVREVEKWLLDGAKNN